MEKVRALVLLSGGLDSLLAARLLLEQGIDVVGITFISSFFNATRGLEAAKQLGIPLIAYNIAKPHLDMVKQPKYGYGKNANPCIDCHSMMIRKAKEIMEGEEVVLFYPDGSIKAISQKYDFVATGEVLGQRPMSQTMRALKVVEKYSGLGDRLVRPLSAKLLEETAPEKEGKVDREGLLDINGRSRARQTELAEKFGLKDYPSPAGGCLLTAPEFSVKLLELFKRWPDCDNLDVELLKYGRVFWLEVTGKAVLAIIGRDEKENMQLEKFQRPGDLIGQVVDVFGPVALVRSKSNELARLPARQGVMNESVSVQIPRELNVEKVKKVLDNETDLLDVLSLLIGYYATKARGQEVQVKFSSK
jgi:tRNA-uridine 2-sulfurtransferase